jgi:ubiquinone/menaquinone biosynthesis C-methylase UbiE
VFAAFEVGRDRCYVTPATLPVARFATGYAYASAERRRVDQTNSATQDALIVAQFGSRSTQYVASTVHSQGEDLQQIAALAATAGRVRVLDLGCGGGHVSFTVAPHVADVVAYDLSTEMLATVASVAKERGLENVGTVAGSVTSLPFADGTFDLVLTRYSAHHWDDIAKGLAEARRVLRDSGQAVFIDVAAPARPVLDTFLQAIEVFRDPSHVRDYSPREWEQLLTQAGFRIERTVMRRLHLEFASWIERMNTPQVRAEAIRSLQQTLSNDVVGYFEITPRGDFTVDTIDILASASSAQ